METAIEIINALMSKLSGIESKTLLDAIVRYFPEAYDKCTKDSVLISNLNNIILPIGLVLLIIYYSIDLMSKAAAADFTTETFVRSLIKFVIGFALITNCYKLSDGIISFGNAVVSDITSVVTNGGTLDYGMSTQYEDIIFYLTSEKTLLSLKQLLFLTSKALLQLLLNSLMTVVVVAVAYSRAIKLVVYQLFLPLSIADIFGGGIYGGGITHIKRILAMALQYPIVYIIGLLTVIFIDQIPLSMGNWIAYMGQILIIMIAVVKEVKKSADTANEIFR